MRNHFTRRSIRRTLGNVSDGYSVANAAMGAMKAYDALNALAKGGNIASVSATVGFSASKSEASGESSTPVVTTVDAGRAVAIEAGNDITDHGVQISAGNEAAGQPRVSDDPLAGDILLSAGHDISFKRAEASNSSYSERKQQADFRMDLNATCAIAFFAELFYAIAGQVVK